MDPIYWLGNLSRHLAAPDFVLMLSLLLQAFCLSPVISFYQIESKYDTWAFTGYLYLINRFLNAVIHFLSFLFLHASFSSTVVAANVLFCLFLFLSAVCFLFVEKLCQGWAPQYSQYLLTDSFPLGQVARTQERRRFHLCGINIFKFCPSGN